MVTGQKLQFLDSFPFPCHSIALHSHYHIDNTQYTPSVTLLRPILSRLNPPESFCPCKCMASNSPGLHRVLCLHSCTFVGKVFFDLIKEVGKKGFSDMTDFFLVIIKSVSRKMAHGYLMENCPRDEKWSVTIFVFYM